MVQAHTALTPPLTALTASGSSLSLSRSLRPPAAAAAAASCPARLPACPAGDHSRKESERTGLTFTADIDALDV